MAVQRKYTLALGGHMVDVTEASGDNTNDDTVTVNIDLTNMQKSDAVRLLQTITEYIIKNNWPPA